MKKYVLILLVMLTLANSIAIGQIKPIKRQQKPKTETPKGHSRSKKSDKRKAAQKTSSNTQSSNQSISLHHFQRENIIRQAVEDMIYIKGGSIMLGATNEQGIDADEDEKPARRVTLPSYYICKYEVTQELWDVVMGSNPSQFDENPRCPVENVSWGDCLTFIGKLNDITGMSFRLPTEEEWEYAARGGERSNGYKYSGSNILSSVAWFSENSEKTTHPVGTKQPNELGLYDMSGNVWEWCQGGNVSGQPIRGGGWRIGAKYCRVSNRDRRSPSDSDVIIGFRLAATSL